MSESEATPVPVPVKKPVRKRSPIERTLVWGGISVLLVAVAMEWNACRGYEATVEALDKVMAGDTPLAKVDLPKHVRGYAVIEEGLIDRDRVVTVRWPSLFKLHKLRVGIQMYDTVKSVEKYDPNVPFTKKAFPPGYFGPPPKKGLPAGFENVVALTTTEFAPVTNTKSSFLRELVRQGLLMAAREGLDVRTLDPSVGDLIPNEDSPHTFPLYVKSYLDSAQILSQSQTEALAKTQPPAPPGDGSPAPQQFVLKIELNRYSIDGTMFHWKAPSAPINGETLFESVAEHVEALSRGPYVEALKTAGFTRSEASKSIAAAAEVKVDDRMDFVSQFAMVRSLHAQARRTGESPELLENLARAYVNLGNLTDFHWSPASKVFKARALLYSQRLIATAGQTPRTLAHRAYVLALIGRHGAATKVVQQARAAQGTELPEWLDLIEAYCAYEPEKLDIPKGPLHELAMYLQMRMTDVDFDQQESVKRVERFQAINPACCRAAETLGEMHALGVQRMLTEGGFNEMWPAIYRRLEEVPDLPDEARALARKGSRIRPDDASAEYANRAEFVSQLQKSTPASDAGTPSWGVLAELIKDVSFVQAWRTLDVEANMLGVDSDDSLEMMKPLYEGHRHAKFLESFVSDRHKGQEKLLEFVRHLDDSRQEPAELPIASELYEKEGPHVGSQMLTKMRASGSDIYEDLIRFLEWDSDTAGARSLFEISPQWPRSIAQMIEYDWKSVESRADEWEKAHGESGRVLKALAKRHIALKRYDDAIRCLKKSIDVTPTYGAYKSLAGVYRSQGDAEHWQEALEQALKLPSLGLEAASVHSELATTFLRKGDLKTARLHGQAAAQSYSAWGLLVGSRCAEALGLWKEAENYVHAVSARYRENAPEWYFWCVRTGRGDIKAARKLADAYLEDLHGPLDHNQTWILGASQLIDGKIEKARKTFTQAFLVKQNTSAGVIAAIMAESAGDTEFRDHLLRELDRCRTRNDAYSEFGNLMRCEVSGEESGRWNVHDFELLLVGQDDRTITYLNYVAGLFLHNRNQKELADQYLQTAATSFNVQGISCMLANHSLRTRKIDIGKTRQAALPDAIATLEARLRISDRARGLGKFDEAEAPLEEIHKIDPGFLPGRIWRAKLYEARENYAAAIAEYEAAIQIDPACAAPHRHLAWMLATCEKDEIRNGQKALEHALRYTARRKTQTVNSNSALAAAYAECGDCQKAAEIHKRSERLPGYTPEDDKRLQSYLAGKPIRVKLVATEPLIKQIIQDDDDD